MTDPRSQWKWAAKKANLLKDPWRGLGFERLQEMIVQRHVYNPRTKKWWKDDISIKMEEKVVLLFLYAFFARHFNYD